MKNHFDSSRFTTIVLITMLTLMALVILTSMDSGTGKEAVGPAFLALGILWGAIGASKIAEHATRHLKGEDDA